MSCRLAIVMRPEQRRPNRAAPHRHTNAIAACNAQVDEQQTRHCQQGGERHEWSSYGPGDGLKQRHVTMLWIAGAIGRMTEPVGRATRLGELFPNRNEFY
ncbi:hypothetical protein [Burkholderia puraquae]|uniref:hypothetical protein n=1 Tax=Burkholderia puraquae TaxID=1904757 RepID=UPI0015829687|nr:hypothetical protein [Burkholderia puraquae]